MLAVLAVVLGFALLLWSADRFVEGASATAQNLGVGPLVIGIVIVGFGTSAPEMVVSAMAAADGNPDLALGNAYGSNIINTGLILGVTALLSPIAVHSAVVRRELPLLLVVGGLSGLLLLDRGLARSEAALLLFGFFALVGWSMRTALRDRADALAGEVEQELRAHAMSLGRALFLVVIGLIVLVASSRMLVWGAVAIAESLGISDLIVGLTIVALGTSLPELATSIVAARKSEHDIALGNIVGSNMFNLMAVVGIAVAIEPMPAVPAEVVSRDWLTMMAMTIGLFVMAYGFRGPGVITRVEGAVLLLSYVAYNIYLIGTIT